MISGDHHQQIYGTGKNGPTTRHVVHHPPNHSNSNYNVGSYGYDNYAIDDDMMMLDEDDLEDVDRLYDMDAVWADEKHKAAQPNSSTKKVCIVIITIRSYCVRFFRIRAVYYKIAGIMNEQTTRKINVDQV